MVVARERQREGGREREREREKERERRRERRRNHICVRTNDVYEKMHVKLYLSVCISSTSSNSIVDCCSLQ